MYLLWYCFVYVGLNVSSRKYEDIPRRSWEYEHIWTLFLTMFMGQIESYKQCYVHNDIHIDICQCIEIERGEMNMP